VEHQQITIAGQQRTYLHYPAQGMQAPSPLVIMLHGTGGSAAFAAQETHLGPFLAHRGISCVFPDGLPINPAALPRFLTNPQRWNDGSTQPGSVVHSDADDVAFLVELIKKLIADGHADPSRIYLTGFSNGAGMAFRMAAEHPALLAGIAPVSGYCHMRPRHLYPRVPTLYITGDADLLIPWQGGPVRLPWGNMSQTRPAVLENLRFWADALGCGAMPMPITDTPTVWLGQYPGPCEFSVVLVKDLGHHWPGGAGLFNPRIAGPHHTAVSANTLLHEFFTRHSSSSGDHPLQ
jgi:polyhydroxybutyrate depolymerase